MPKQTYPTDIVPITFKFGPAWLITSASILSVNEQKIASFPTTPCNNLSRGTSDASDQLSISHLKCWAKILIKKTLIDFVVNILTRFAINLCPAMGNLNELKKCVDAFCVSLLEWKNVAADHCDLWAFAVYWQWWKSFLTILEHMNVSMLGVRL